MKYNVGDKVLIKSYDWYKKNKDENGSVLCNYNYYFTRLMTKYCGEVMTVKDIINVPLCRCYMFEEDEFMCHFTDDMIEGLVEEETKPIENMEFNSQVCTNKTQSKKLIELGLRKETGDFYTPIKLNPDKGSLPCSPEFWTSDDPFIKRIREASIPAWSLHRLIKIVPEYFANTKMKFRVEAIKFLADQEGNIYDNLIVIIEDCIKNGILNKEFLK